MQKVQCLLKCSELSLEELQELATSLAFQGATKAKVAFTEKSITALSERWQQCNQPPLANGLLSVWSDTSIKLSLPKFLDVIAQFKIDEKAVVDYPKLDGIKRIDGVLQVATFKFKQRLPSDSYLHYWRETHANTAWNYQSTNAYIQNYIPNGDIDGIAEELFSIEAMSDPLLFFAASSKTECKENMQEIIDSSNQFIDMASLNVNHMAVYQII